MWGNKKVIFKERFSVCYGESDTEVNLLMDGWSDYAPDILDRPL